MRRFLLGFFLGVACAALVASVLWGDGSADDGFAPTVRVPATTAPAPTTAAESAADLAPTRTEREHAQVAPNTRVDAAPTAPVPTVLARLDELIVAADWKGVQAEIGRLLRADRGVVIPRAFVERILDRGRKGSRDERQAAARGAMRTWPAEWVVRALRQFLDNDDARLVGMEDWLGARLAVRGGGPADLRQALLRSNAHKLRRVGLEIAAKMDPTDTLLLERTYLTRRDSSLRRTAAKHLLREAGRGDDGAATTSGRLALAVMNDPDSTADARRLWLSGLSYSGDPGLDHIQRIVLAGGLEKNDRRSLVDDLVEGGRFARLLALGVAHEDDELLSDLAHSVFLRDEDPEDEILALWPHLPRLIRRPPPYDWKDVVADKLMNLGRSDLVGELFLNPIVPHYDRVRALDELVMDDSARGSVLDAIVSVLNEPSSSPGLRQDVISELEEIAGPDEPHGNRSRAILERVASTDPNEWVRAAARAALEEAAR